MVAYIRYVNQKLNAPPSGAIFRVNVTHRFGYIQDEAVVLPKHLSILPPVNRDVLTDHWEDRILWSDPESESDADADNEEDEDDEDNEDGDNGDEKRIPLFIDLNDPAMLYEAGVLRPQRLFEVILQQGKGRARVANTKLKRIAGILADQKCINRTGESRFNISNDEVRCRRRAGVNAASLAARKPAFWLYPHLVFYNNNIARGCGWFAFVCAGLDVCIVCAVCILMVCVCLVCVCVLCVCVLSVLCVYVLSVLCVCVFSVLCGYVFSMGVCVHIMCILCA